MSSLWGFLKWSKFKKQELELQSTAIGINSTVGPDLHVVMLDYDEKDVDKVIESIIELQEFWNLSDASIYQTRNGHHAIFWYDQVPYERLKMIIDFARYVDPMFKYISRFYTHKTLRAKGKYETRDIFFIDVIEGRRTATENEKEIGELKKKEHEALISSL